MASKKEEKAFIEGMEAGAKPFEEKFEQHAKELENSKKEIMYQIGEIGAVQDELIDIAEEQDEQLKRMNEKIQYGLKDKEVLADLTKGEKEVLGGLLVELSKQFNFNEKQQQFVANIFRLLGISNPQDISFDVIDDVENITTQKVLYRVMVEVMFLENSNGDFSEDVLDVLDYFSISGKQKVKIQEETDNYHKATGDNGLINKYSVSEEELQAKKRKSIPKLEVSMEVRLKTEYGSLLYLAMEDTADLLSENCKSYSTAESYYEEVIEENYENMRSYLSESNTKYIGNDIIDFYHSYIDSVLNQIIDYINVNRLHINVTDLMEMRDECEEELKQQAREEMQTIKELYNTHSIYLIGREIEEDTDYVDTFFGGMKEVTVYRPSYDSLIEAVERMTKNLQEMERLFDMGMHTFVVDRYLCRIANVVNQINIACGNDEEEEIDKGDEILIESEEVKNNAALIDDNIYVREDEKETMIYKKEDIEDIKAKGDENYTNENFLEALKWYQIAAEQGDDYSQNKLGCMLWNGKGGDINKSEANVWFEKAAQNGNIKAQYNIGVSYLNGEGIEEDTEKAFFWIKKAAEQGDKDAKKKMEQWYGTRSLTCYWSKQDFINNMIMEIKGVCRPFVNNSNGMFEASYKLKENLGIGNEEVYLGYDATIFGNGKNGFAITKSGIYCKEFMSSSVAHISYEALYKTSGNIYVNGENIYGDGKVLAYVSGLTDGVKEEVKELLYNIYLKAHYAYC